MYTIMLVEDDKELRPLIAEYLDKYGYTVYSVSDFKNVEREFEKASPDLILLDINLPYYDGFYLCRVFRRKSNVPIIIISARSGDMDQVMGIELGADDYIVKPFSCELLQAKIKAALRRSKAGPGFEGSPWLHARGLALDMDALKLHFGKKSAELSKNEFKLLRKLMEEKDRFVTREELLQELWDDSSFVDDGTLTVNVSRVKSKLLELGVGVAVKTKRGMGYMLDSTAAGTKANE